MSASAKNLLRPLCNATIAAKDTNTYVPKSTVHSFPLRILHAIDKTYTFLRRRSLQLPGPLQAQQRCDNPDGSRVAGCTDGLDAS